MTKKEKALVDIELQPPYIKHGDNFSHAMSQRNNHIPGALLYLAEMFEVYSKKLRGVASIVEDYKTTIKSRSCVNSTFFTTTPEVAKHLLETNIFTKREYKNDNNVTCSIDNTSYFEDLGDLTD